MKLPALLGLVLAVTSLTTGCSRFYYISTTSGRVLTAKGKPRFDKEQSSFTYMDVKGQERTISAGSVRQISPASDKVDDPTAFKLK